MLEYAKNYLKNYAALKVLGPAAVRYPLLASYYVTYRCNLQCAYCSDGAGIPFYEHRTNECTLEQATELLKRILPSTTVLDITGGEPLMRPDIQDIIRSARSLGFKRIFLNTNGLLLHRFPGIVETVDSLIISLDSLDPELLASIYRTNRKNIDRILTNINGLWTSHSRAKVVISTVLMPDNLRHIPALMDFCLKHDFGFAVSPALKGTQANAGLMSSKEYQRCIDEILKHKEQGLVVLGSKRYFNTIRHFTPYRCYPLLMVTIDPQGRVNLPCLEIADQKASLFDFPNMSQLMSAYQKNRSVADNCGNVCHIFCHAGLSDLLENPLTSVYEAYIFGNSAHRAFAGKTTAS